MGFEVDSLDINLKTHSQTAITSIDTFISKLDRLNASLTKINGSGLTGVANGVNKLSTAMQGMKNVGTADFTRLANNITKLGSLNSQSINRAASSIGQISKALSSLKSVKVSETSTQIKDLATGISRLGYKSSTKAIDNIPKLATAMRDLMSTLSKAPRVSQNLIDMTNALAKLARTGASSGRAATSVSRSLDSYTKSSNRASKSSWSLAAAIGKVYATYWILFRAFGKIRDAINIASDLVEVQNVVDTVFGDMTSKVEEYADKSIEQFGMSELAFKQYASRFQAMGSAMGIDSGLIGNANKFLNKSTNGYVELSDSMADVSLNLTKLAADMASFYNVEQSAVAEDLAAIFTGETRPLRTYGLDLTQATLSEWAMKQGLDANIQSMSQAEKTMLRYQYVLANTTAAQGDFIRTQDTWANQVRILQEQLKKWASVIGTGFIAAFKPFLQNLNVVMGKVIDFSENVLNALGKIFGWQFEISGGGITNDLSDSMEDTDIATGDASGSAGDLSDNLGDAAKNAKKLYSTVLGIDELNINNPDTGSSSGGTGGSGSGSGGSGSGGSGSGASGSGLTTVMTRNDALIKAYESSIDSLYELGKYIGDTLNNVLSGIDWDEVYKGARNFGKGLANFLNGLISPKLFGTLGSTVAKSVNTALNGANAFAETFDWDNLGKSLATGVDSFFKDWDAELTGETFSNFASGIIEAMTSAIETLGEEDTFETIGQKIVDFICGIDWGSLTWDLSKFFLALNDAILDIPNDLARGIGQGIIDKIFGEDSGIEMPDISLPPSSLLNLATQFDKIKKWATETTITVGDRFAEGWLISEQAWSNGEPFFSGLWKGIKYIFDPAAKWFQDKFQLAHDGIKLSFLPITTWFHEKWDSVKGVFKDVKSFFKDGFQKAYDAVKSIWDGLGSFFKGIAENAFKPIKSLVNGVIKGVNWVLETVGSKTRVAQWEGINFAKGSDGLPQNTLGVVNDQPGSTYKELIVPPSGKPFIPEGRNVMLPLEKGTKIMPAKQTKAFMSGMPHFAGGIGDFFGNTWDAIRSFTGDVFDYLTHPGDIIKIAIDKFTKISDFVEPWLSVAGGMVNKTFESIVDYITGIFDTVKPKVNYNSSAGVEQWRQLAAYALKLTNQYSDANLNLLLYQMQTESGGNPNAVNNWDINAKNGTPSKGLMQVIDPTFNAYAMKGYNTNIYDPLSNMIAAIRYTVSRYGSLANGWKGHGYASGIGKITLADLIPAYSVGGFPEDGLFFANHNELVGQFSNGKTAVANNPDIQKGIEEAAYRGFVRASQENTRETTLLEELIDAVREGKEIVVDGRSLTDAVDRRRSRNGYSFT